MPKQVKTPRFPDIKGVPYFMFWVYFLLFFTISPICE